MAEPFWNQLFSGPAVNSRFTARLIRKRGVPLLLLPLKPRLAARGLELYPAQTAKARTARALLRCAIRWSLPFTPGGGVSVPFSLHSPLVQFLKTLAPTTDMADLAIFAGNASDDSQRFIVLLFDEKAVPRAVVKLGLAPRARALVNREADFLASIPEGMPGIPRTLDRLQSDSVTALALPYLAGASPKSRDHAAVRNLLSNWLGPKAIPIRETKPWQELMHAASAHPLSQRIKPNLEKISAAHTLAHGDFAPWNVKIQRDGTCTALDWERGSLIGMPGWDYFHFFIQPAILVNRFPIQALVEECERLRQNFHFETYAIKAGIADHARHFLLAYLLHMIEVIKPAQGLAENKALLEALVARWRI